MAARGLRDHRRRALRRHGRAACAAARQHEPLRSGARFACGFPELRCRAGAPLAPVGAAGRGRARLGGGAGLRHLCGAQARAVQQRARSAGPGTAMEAQLLHRCSGACRRAARAPAALCLSRHGQRAVPVRAARRDLGSGDGLPDDQPPSDLLDQEGAAARDRRAAVADRRCADRGRAHQLSVGIAGVPVAGLSREHSRRLPCRRETGGIAP